MGKDIQRRDAIQKALGEAKFAGDIKVHGMLYGKIVRSKKPHAILLNVNIDKAKKISGVRCILTSADVPRRRFGTVVKDQTVFAERKVRYVGEPIAVVVADDLETAEEASELVDVEYEELPPVFDAELAMDVDSPLIHEEFDEYTVTFPARRWGNVCSHTTYIRGDVESAFLSSDMIFEGIYRTPMVHQTYLEPQACVAIPEPGGRVTVWSSTQTIFIQQFRIAEALGLPYNRVRVIGTYVGGAFGGKIEPTVQIICACAAMRAQRPVRIVLTREEEFELGRPRHPAVVKVKTGVMRTGELRAAKVSLVYDTGAYAEEGPLVVAAGSQKVTGCYRVPNVHVDAYCVYTNKPICGAYRGYGNPQQTFAFESHLDTVAKELGMDPWELRYRNAVEKGDTVITGEVLRSCGFKECLQAVRPHVERWKSMQKECGTNGGHKKIGIGLGCVMHVSGVLTSSAIAKLNEDGTVTLLVAAAELGQGCDTVLAQIAAEELGLPVEGILLGPKDTDTNPYSWETVASRTTYTSGNAVRRACAELKTRLLSLAAEQLGVAAEELLIRDGIIRATGDPDKKISVHELARMSYWRRSGPILGTGSYICEGPPRDPEKVKGSPGSPYGAFVFGADAACVSVDLRTGVVEVLDFVGAHDVGKVVNPTNVEGQIQGAVTQGIGYALLEEVAFRDGVVWNNNLLDYKIPTFLDVPGIKAESVETLDPTGPFGAKGIGEPALVGVAPAIANAIFDATGARIDCLPMTPERILERLGRRERESGG